MRTQSICLALAIVLLCATGSAQWVRTNGPFGGVVSCFAVSGTNLFAGTYGGGVFLSKNSGTSWTQVNNGLTNTYVSTIAVSGTNLFAGLEGGIFLSTNNGEAWTDVSIGPRGRQVNVLTCKGTQLLAACGRYILGNLSPGGAYRSTNDGATWDTIGFAGGVVYDFAVKGSYLFATTFYGGPFLSTDDGATWENVNSGLPTSAWDILAVCGDLVYVSAFGVYRSTNNGTSWTAVNEGLPSNDGVSAFGVSGTNIFAGTSGSGVFLSTNNGTSWTAVNEGLPSNAGISAFGISDTYVFAGTSGGGVWRRPLSEMVTSVGRQSSNVPTHFSLEQNHPNPFNPSTNISFSVPSKSFVTLKVFNVLGAEIASLVSENKPPGTYQVTWDAKGFPSGVYFYRLVSAGKVFTGKMNLLK